MKKIKSVNSAVDTLINSAQERAKAILKGKYKIANKNYDMIKEVIVYLKDNDAICKLEDLLSHEDISVRMIAATNLLPNNEEKAISVLEDIVNLKTLYYSFESKMILSEWRKRNMKI
jgi:HEAT repeat protein